MRERPDGMLEATSFEEHMAPGLNWVDDPRFAAAFGSMVESEAMSEETSERVASAAAKILQGKNPFQPGGALYGRMLELFGTAGSTLDGIEKLAVDFEPIGVAMRSVAASALTQHVGDGEAEFAPGKIIYGDNARRQETAWTNPSPTAYPGFINLQLTANGEMQVIVRPDAIPDAPDPAPVTLTIPMEDWHQLIASANLLQPPAGRDTHDVLDLDESMRVPSEEATAGDPLAQRNGEQDAPGV